MGRSKQIINLALVRKAEIELICIKDSQTSIKLKAIISAGTYTVKDVAEILQVSSVSIFKWAKLFNQYGIEGLQAHPKGHMRSKLTEKHKEEILKWIDKSENNKGEQIIWTIDKLRKEIKEVFNVEIGRTPLWKHLKNMDLVLRKPRPEHYKADKSLQEAFKKNFKSGE